MPEELKPHIRVYTLAIEVTRECNMNPPCEMCLRGAPQSLSISYAHMRSILSQIDEIHEVVFTGGEPTLNLQAIRKFIELAELYHVTFESFYIVTNGIANQLELATLTLEMYRNAEDKESCGVAMSEDMFHDSTKQDPLIKGLAYYRQDKEHDPAKDDLNWVLRRGNAEDNGIGKPKTWAETDFDIDSYDEGSNSVEIELVYLSATGYLYPDCDMSYRDMDDDQRLFVNNFRTAIIEKIKAKENDGQNE